MNLAERLKIFRESLGLTQEEFAKKLNTTQAVISNYERGARIPTADFLNRLTETFHLNINWLLTGEGPMFREKEVRKEEEPPPSREDSSEGLSPELLRALSHPTIRSIALMLSEMSEEDIKEILKRVEEKATLKRLLKEVETLKQKLACE